MFYDRLNGVLDEAGFDREVETLCAMHYVRGVGRPGVPPGRYFRMLFMGYFEGLESARRIAWRCADSLSLRQFLKLGTREGRITARCRSGWSRRTAWSRAVGSGSTPRPWRRTRRCVRSCGADSAGWQAMLGELARTSGMAPPTTDQLRQFDRSRAGKRVSNADWVSPTDPAARLTRLKDGRTRLAYQPEHAVDLDTGAIVVAEVDRGAAGDRQTLEATLEAAAATLEARDLAPAPGASTEVVADKGYHARDVLKRLAGSPWTPRLAAPTRRTVLRWRGDDDARRAVNAHRARLLSGVARMR